MTQGRPAHAPMAPTAPQVRYTHADTRTLLDQSDTLAVIDFGAARHAQNDDPRHLHVPLPAIDSGAAPRECWQVQSAVTHGVQGAVRWSSGGGWLFAALQLAEAEHDGDIGRTAEHAYRTLCDFLRARPDGQHVQRLWNYLDDINRGDGDAERYKQFCGGRARGMGEFFGHGFPAATAIGQPRPSGLLTVYCLSNAQPGRRIENPRQLSAWRYPRQYGRTPPVFTRAMRLPAGDALAISGTAAITGHQSRHAEDLAAQLAELKTNLDSLLHTAAMPEGFDAHAPIKVYLRHDEDAAAVTAFLDRHMPAAPRLLLKGDICRHELLVEIDGWRYA